MSEREEAMFQDLVRAVAPAPRDPMFRLKLLERRENERFRRRSSVLVAVALAAVLGAAFFSVVRPASIDAAAVVFFGIAASAVCFFYAPRFLRNVSFFRRSR